MSNDKIAEIRARHETDERWRLTASMICPGAHNDRATLLAEDARKARRSKDLKKNQRC